MNSGLKVINSFMTKMKNSLEPVMALLLGKFLFGFLPLFIANLIASDLANKCSIVFTNVPGTRIRQEFAGTHLTKSFFIVPALAKVGVGISIYTYLDVIKIGVFADTNILEHPKILIDIMQKHLDLLLKEK
jgi:hypothetical protein